MPVMTELIKDCNSVDMSTLMKYFSTLEYALDLVDKTITTEKGFHNGIQYGLQVLVVSWKCVLGDGIS